MMQWPSRPWMDKKNFTQSDTNRDLKLMKAPATVAVIQCAVNVDTASTA